jgi:hypothetical protein
MPVLAVQPPGCRCCLWIQSRQGHANQALSLNLKQLQIQVSP